jgi:drug/metabolite transporter (DMT)-like permease
MSAARPATQFGPVIFWMTGALISFSLMAIVIRTLAGKLSLFEILTIRNTFGILFLAALALARPALRAQLKTPRPGLHVFRNSVHFAATYLWALGVTLLPLATVFALEFTTPAWVAIFAVLFLGERLTASRLGAILLGFAGVLVIVQPGLGTFQPATLVVLLSAVCFGLSIVSQKKLTTTDSTFCILFSMNLMQLPMAVAGMYLTGGDFGFVNKLGWSDLWAVAGIAIVGLSGHFCLTNAFRSGDAIVVIPLDFLRIPLIAVVGYLLYREPLDPLVFAGAAFIIGGILWNVAAEAQRKPAPAR